MLRAACLLVCVLAGAITALPVDTLDPPMFHDLPQGATSAVLEFLAPSTEGVCLDGSPYGFYWREGSNTDKWSISIEGGGWCYNETLCYERSKTRLGTSTVWPKEGGCGCALYFPNGSSDESCNCAYLPYGDGASFSGYRKDAFPVSEWPAFDNSTAKIPADAKLYFRGIKSFDGVLDTLFARGLGKAKEVVVTGGSAGGLSTFLHVDRVAQRVKAVNPNAVVHGLPVVGFFLDHANEAHTASTYPSWMDYIHTMQNLTTDDGRGHGGGLMQSCLQKFTGGEAYKCFMSPHEQAFIESPYFMLNSKYDQWQMDNILQSPCAGRSTVVCNQTEQEAVLQYGKDFMTQFSPVPTSKGGQNGAFITSCICHGCPWPELVLRGKSTYEAVGQWRDDLLNGRLGQHSDANDNPNVYVDSRNPNGDGSLKFSECVKFP